MARWMSVAIVAALVGAAAPLRTASADSADASLEQALIESASTPQQHEALAKYYESKAKHARAEADYHRSMGKAYGGSKATQQAAMKEHCEKLAALSTDQAAQFDMMAKMHRDMAK